MTNHTDTDTDTIPASQIPLGTVAVVYDEDGSLYDYCFGWEAAQNYVLHEGMTGVAVADDGLVTVEIAQARYDSDKAAYDDCWR